MIVDSHCHASPRWFEPVQTLLYQMDRNGVERAVLTQLLGQFDNEYQADCVADHPDRLASVVAVQTADQLRALKGVAGVRIGAALADDALWQAASECGLPVSVSGMAAAMIAPVFVARVEAMTKQIFLLEHLGGIGRPDFDGCAETRSAVFALARFPNLVLKWASARRWPMIHLLRPMLPS
jgi:L-fuconolactonase